ncbi:MAG: VWA domain-containing protein [Longimicrobiales bacterium]
MSVVFAHPALLYLLLLLPVWWVLSRPRRGGVPFSRGESAHEVRGPSIRSRAVAALPRVLRSLALAAGIVALAHPHRIVEVEETTIPGKGVGLALDISSSMLAADLGDGRQRMDVAKEAAVRFAEGRVHDELSLVAFAGEAVTRVPPTTDRTLVVHGVETLDVHLVRDGSDISQALLASVTQLMESSREPRVVVLLSDGAHNGIRVPPLEAARAAQALGIRVHGISILGAEDRARRTSAASRGSSVGDDGRTALEGVAALTGGRYFRATTATDVDSIYRVVNEIEASTEEVRVREEERSLRAALLLLALALLGAEVLVRGSRWGVVR